MRAQRCYWRWSVGTILRTAEIRMEETGEADRVKSRCRNKNAGDSAKRLLEGRREARRKKLRGTIRHNHHVVFAAQAEFTHQVNPRLI